MELRTLARSRAFLAGLVVRVVLLLVVGWTSHLPGQALPWLSLVALAADIAVYQLLLRTGYPERRHEVARLYWLSPLVIWLLYGAGSLASVVALLLVAFFMALERRRYPAAGLAFGLACAGQPALIFVLGPILLVFASSLSRIRAGAVGLVAAAAGPILVSVLWALVDPGYLAHLLGSGELRDLIALHLPSSAGGLAILPLLLTGIVYAAWRARLINRDLLWAFFTLAVIAAVGAGDGSAGMALLLVMLLSSHAAYAERSGRLSLAALSGLLLLRVLLVGPGPSIDGLLLAGGVSPGLLGGLIHALPTLIAIAAVVVGMQVLQRGVLRSHVYLATRRPVAVGIAGDSGTGKDALSDSLAALFSGRTVATVSGDDYHNWDRNKPMWRALTHLNPKANDLTLFNSHVSQLVDRRWVRARHYDHVTGRMTKPALTQPGELIIASGLHALTSPGLNAAYDLRVFLDMDEALRRFLKIRRDVKERGHPLQRVLDSLDRRGADAEAFIHPQKAAAHLVVRLEPRRSDLLDPLEHVGAVPMRLVVEAAPGVSFDRVVRALVTICGIHAVETPQPSGAARLRVEGEPSAADVEAAAHRLAPHAQDFLRAAPGWREGLSGVLQLIMLDQLEQIWERRSVNA